jgi:long-chain acyl-CoA synthetase
MNKASRSLEELYESISTPLEMFYRYEKSRANEICFVQPYPDQSIVQYSWSEVGKQVRSMAAYLNALELPLGSNIALMSTNCAYWIMADIAIWMAGHCSVPLYPVLASKTIKQIMDHCEAKVMFVGKLDGWGAMKEGVPAGTHLISFPLSSENVQVGSSKWEDIIDSQPPIVDSPVYSADNVGTIIYTSGTTGVPKGVMHSFRNMSVVGTLAGELYNITAEDRKISYLPLAHVAERVAIEINQLFYGYTVFFSGSISTFADDIRRASPTIFFAVPRIWNRFQQRVFENISSEQLTAMLSSPEHAPAIKQKLLTSLGLQDLRVAVSGAAPLSTSLIDWYKRLGIEILEGYAMSENFAYCHTTKSGTAKTGYVGTPSPYVECKLSDKGEILAKSPANMVGYYKEPELTAQAIDDDGFLHTGDCGEIDEQNRLRITGRTKELFKTSKGKYIAPSPLEDMLAANFSLELVCVTGAGLTQPIALANLTELAHAEIMSNGRNQIVESLQKTLDAMNQRVDKHENVSHIIVTKEAWSIDNGLITPTLKVKRSVLEEHYSLNFEQWQNEKEQILFEL